MTVAILSTWIGRPCVLEFDDGRKKIYAYGTEEVRGKWEEGKIVMNMDCFCHFWRYKTLEYGLDLFAQQENREERRAICEADNVPETTIRRIYTQAPLIYGGTP